MSDDSTPYKDVPREDFIKAIHILLLNLTYMVSTVLEEYCDAPTRSLINREIHQLEREVASLLRSEPGACSSPKGPSNGFGKLLNTSPAKSLNELNSWHARELAGIAEKYSIEPGTIHYFPKGHPSGLGGLSIYFPNRPTRYLSELPEGTDKAQGSDPGPFEAHQNSSSSIFLIGYPRWSQRPRRLLQHAKNLFRRSS
ncbi:MAG TPA: hypothetical protein PK587_04260 [Syntrophales bacterium]|nr:hypothetical protein [Syntrophales bacterium]